MTITRMDTLLAHARQDGYAIGYYESWDQYSMEGVIEAAEQMASPAILGFGAAVSNQDWLDRIGVAALSRTARLLAERAAVPVAVLFNEARTLRQIRIGLDNGCNAVMLDSAELPYAENVAATRAVVTAARAAEASVEAELGHLADAINPDGPQSVLTDPRQAADFVARTGVDALAVSIGNVHLALSDEAPVNLDLLDELRAAARVPLVIHGGTGFPRAAVTGAVARGVAKFNVGTRTKRLFLAGVRDALPDPMTVRDIHPYVGSRDPADVTRRGVKRMQAEIMDLMKLYGSAGRAGAFR